MWLPWCHEAYGGSPVMSRLILLLTVLSYSLGVVADGKVESVAQPKSRELLFNEASSTVPLPVVGAHLVADSLCRANTSAHRSRQGLSARSLFDIFPQAQIDPACGRYKL